MTKLSCDYELLDDMSEVKDVEDMRQDIILAGRLQREFVGLPVLPNLTGGDYSDVLSRVDTFVTKLSSAQSKLDTATGRTSDEKLAIYNKLSNAIGPAQALKSQYVEYEELKETYRALCVQASQRGSTA